MKTFLKITSATILATALYGTAQAERAEGGKPDVTASITQGDSEAAKAQNSSLSGETLPVAAHVLAALGDAREIDEDGDVTEQSLRAFYAGSAASAIWISDGKPNQKARDAAAEIAKAEQFGMNPNDFKLPAIDTAGDSTETQAKYELAMTRALLAFANQAKTGRIHPSKVRHSLNNPTGLEDPRGFLQSLKAGDDVVAVLRDLHPKHPQFVALQKKLAELTGANEEKPRVSIPDGPVLKLGESHDHVALLRKRLEIAGADSDGSRKFDETVFEAVKAFQKSKGIKQDGVVGNGTRHALNGESNEQLKIRILTNMERWRWLPDNMYGDAKQYIWSNIPEYRVRIIKNDKFVFDERMIVGKTNKKTPVFSDAMEWIEIHPVWYVPMSIIVDDIGPSLRRTTSTVMERYHLQLNCGAHGRDWKKIDWNKVSIRKCSVSQPPGKRSVLGDFKFKFPNKHIVYMHDTPQKKLFNTTVRTYSHGCMRIRNPRRMAEILLETDKGMPASRLGQILSGPKRPHREDLKKHIPVHVTYFTVTFDAEGNLKTFRDVYAHDRRLAELLTGKGELLPRPAIAAPRKRPPAPRRTRTAGDRQWNNAFSAN